MAVDLTAGIVRILKPDGTTAGTGFVVSDAGLIATCAHVVELCDAGPGDSICTVFYINGRKREAEVLADFWRPQTGDDVAVLRLVPVDEPLPQDIKAVKLGFSRHCNGHRMQTLGFPQLEGGYDVVWAEGNLRGVVPHRGKQPMLQMDARPIRRGMSGAPVLDLDTQRVVGMVSEYLPNAPLEWATTSETMQEICPDYLSLHLPQAVEDYLAALHNYCANLPYLTLHDIRPPKTLDEVYVPLKARPQPREDEEQQLNQKHATKDQTQKFDEERAIREMQRHEPLSIAEVMQWCEQPHVLILGEPGGGKSTLLRQLAECAWDAPQKIGLEAPHLPILVPLRRLTGPDGSVEDRLSRAVCGEIALERALGADFFTDWPAQTGARWLILLDALDEVPVAERARLIQWLKGILKRIEPNRVVITSRPSGYTPGELDEELFGHYDLQTFTPEQTDEFAHKWFGDRADQFLDELGRVRVGDLRGTPLLLTIAAKVFLEEGRLPVRRSALYGQFVDIWLREAEQRGLKAELGEQICDAAKYILARLALLTTEQPGEASQAMLSHVTATFLGEALHLPDVEAQSNAPRIVQVMARRSGVFIRHGDTYEFVHPTFREYLAAWDVVQECRQDLRQVWERVVSRWEDENWREVALFALGILSDKGTDVTALVKRVWQGNLLERILGWGGGKYFVGVALAEQAQVDTDLGNSIIDGLLARARTSGDAISVLTELREYPRVTEALQALAHDETVSTWMRVQVAEALGELGRADEAAPVLLALARGDWVFFGVPEQAVEALGELGRADDLLALARDEKVYKQVRERAAEALGKLGRVDEAAPILLTLALDEKVYEQVRERAAEAMGELGRDDEAARAWMALALDDRLLGQMSDDKIVGWMLVRAFKALSELGWSDEAGVILLTLARDEMVVWQVRERAAEALGELGRAAEAAQAWLALARDERLHGRVSEQAAEALGELGRADEAAPILLALARDEKMVGWVRERAAKALGQFADVRVLHDLEHIARRHKDNKVGRAAWQAIERIRRRIRDEGDRNLL